MAGERNVVGNMIAVAQTGVVLVKVILLVGFSMAIFVTAYGDIGMGESVSFRGRLGFSP